MKELLILAALAHQTHPPSSIELASSPPSASDGMTVVRRCIDDLHVQMFAMRDQKGRYWYGSPMVKGMADMLLDPDALDQVCPEGPVHHEPGPNKDQRM